MTSLSAEQPVQAVSAQRRLILLLMVVLTLWGAALYARGVGGAFVFDDRPQIIEAPRVRNFFSFQWLTHPDRRKVVSFTLAVNHAISGVQTWSYHLTNIAIHIGCGLTLFELVRRTLRTPAWAHRFTPQRAQAVAFAAAILWLSHPLNTQAVTYVIQRAESLMALFCLLMLLCLVVGHESRRPVVWYMLAVVCCFLGMASKEIMVVAPVLALLYDRTFLAGTFARIGRRYALHAALFATNFYLLASGVMRVIFPPPVRRRDLSSDLLADGGTTVTEAGRQAGDVVAGMAGAAGDGSALQSSLDPLLQDMSRLSTLVPDLASTVSAVAASDPTTWWQYLFTQAQVIPFYLWLAIWPDRLAIDHAWPIARSFDAGVAAGFAFLGAAFLAALWLFFRGKPWLGFCLLSFFIVLAPTSSVVPIDDAVFEHRMYLPLAPLIVAMVIGMDAWLRRRPIVALTLLMVLTLALSARTVTRVGDYESAVSIWRANLRVTPDNHRAWINLAGALVDEQRDLDAGQRAYEKVLELRPNHTLATVNLGNIAFLRGDLDLAERYVVAALRRSPANVEALRRLGSIHHRRGEFDKAEAFFRRALEARPRDVPAHDLLGVTLSEQGRYAEAAQVLLDGIALNPDYASLYANLAQVFRRTGERERAVDLLRTAAELDPRNPAIANLLGQSLAETGDLTQAIAWFRKALASDPGYATAHANLGTAWLLQGQRMLAANSFRQAVEADPSNLSALNRLAWILATDDHPLLADPPEAVRLATRLNEQSDFGRPLYLETLAAAQLATGDRDAALATMARAIATAQAIGMPEASVRRLLERQRRLEQGLPAFNPAEVR